MKKIIKALFVLLFLANFTIFASNDQKIQPVSSDVYQAIDALYISQGLSQPSTALPYSNAELKVLLERINVNNLNNGERSLYNYVSEIANESPNINSKHMGMTWSFDTNFELYYHSNSNYVGRDKWVRGWNDQLPFLRIGFETWPGDSFYGFSELPFQNYYHNGGETNLSKDFGSINLMTNIPGLVNPSSFQLFDLNLNVPYRAFVSVGGDSWSLQLGRDRASWGPGITGNMMLGDNLKYHNMVRYTAFSPIFKYTFITSFFPHPSLYYDQDSNNVNSTTSSAIVKAGPSNQWQKLNGIEMFMAHRLEWTIADFINFTLSESIIYQNENNMLDLQVFNPVMIFHDYYIRSNANSLLSFELGITPIKNLNIYGQLAVDEFALPGEDDTNPQSMGYQVGAKGFLPLDSGLLYGSLEYAHTDPYLYLRDDGSSSYNNGNYSIDYVVAIRNYCDQTGTWYDEQFLGYKYGNDAIVMNMNLGFNSFKNWSVESNVMYMQHGTFDMWTLWKPHTSPSTPTTSHGDNLNSNDSDVSDRNSVEHTLIAGISGNYKLTSFINCFAQFDYVSINNYQNVSGAKLNDIQLTTGLSISL